MGLFLDSLTPPFPKIEIVSKYAADKNHHALVNTVGNVLQLYGDQEVANKTKTNIFIVEFLASCRLPCFQHRNWTFPSVATVNDLENLFVYFMKYMEA